MDDQEREAIQQVLERLPFIRWDRYVTSPPDGFGHSEHSFYGWIDRDQDSYKDFVLLRFYKGEADWMTTSSAKHTHEISATLGFEEEDHNDCIRVDETFPQLQNKTTLSKVPNPRDIMDPPQVDLRNEIKKGARGTMTRRT